MLHRLVKWKTYEYVVSIVSSRVKSTGETPTRHRKTVLIGLSPENCTHRADHELEQLIIDPTMSLPLLRFCARAFITQIPNRQTCAEEPCQKFTQSPLEKTI